MSITVSKKTRESLLILLVSAIASIAVALVFYKAAIGIQDPTIPIQSAVLFRNVYFITFPSIFVISILWMKPDHICWTVISHLVVTGIFLFMMGFVLSAYGQALIDSGFWFVEFPMAIFSPTKCAVYFCIYSIFRLGSPERVTQYLVDLIQSKSMAVLLLMLSFFVSIIAPFLFPRVINIESGLAEYARIIDVSKYESRVKVVHIEDEKTAREIYTRIQLHKSADFYERALPFIYDGDDRKGIVKIIQGPDLSVACYFAYDLSLKDGCIDQMRSNKLPGNRKVRVLTDLETISPEIRNAVVAGANIHSNGSALANPGIIQSIRIGSIGGYLMHHYNYIIQGLYSGLLSDEVQNQYGAGPLLLVKAVSLALNNDSLIDAAFILIPVSNVIALLSILRLFGANQVVIFGYIVSVSCTLLASNIVAPLLYYIRILPLFIALVTAARLSSQKPIAEGLEILFASSMLIASFYSKEYALLAFLSALVVGVLAKSRSYLAISLVVGLGVSTQYVIAAGSFYHGANIALLIDGVGFNSGITPELIVYAIPFCAILVLFASRAREVIYNPHLLFLFVSLYIYTTKFILNPNVNHIGFLYVIMGLILVTMQECSYADVRKLLYPVYFVCGLILIGLSAPALKYTEYLKQYPDREYVSTNISSLFKFDVDLVKKGDELRSNYEEGDCLLSLQDSFLQTYLQKGLSATYMDLSSNVNVRSDLAQVGFALERCGRVIIDNSLLDSSLDTKLLMIYYNQSLNANEHLLPYLDQLAKLRMVAAQQMASKSRCSRFKYFTTCYI